MLPGLSGLAVLERLMRASTRPRVLVISGSVSGQVFKQVLEIGADGVLSKEERPDQLIDAMIATPKLIERPIVIKDGRATIGRPPEKVLEIL